MAFELTYEKLALALETTRRTPVAAPTHVVNGNAPLQPKKEKKTAEDHYGTLAAAYRKQTVRQHGEWEAPADLDVNLLPVYANMVVAPVSAPTTPSGATLARLWTFIRSITSDNIKSATGWWGDPNLQVFRSAGLMADELTISGDASGTDAAKMGIKGMGLYPTKVTAPTYPAADPGALVYFTDAQVWIDTGASAFGTTELTGRVISADLTVPTGVSYKYVAQGPASNKSFSNTGRKPTSPVTKVRFELPDMTEYDEYDQDVLVKVRVRMNGPLLETVTGTDFYYYVEWDGYGQWDDLAWGDLEGTNRTHELTLEHLYESGMGSDLALRVQNKKTAL
jgi:hypothetical protein